MAFTYFFRDMQALDLAVQKSLPALRGRAYIHVWDAGCAHGPEPYTLAILLRERMSEYVFRNVRIHATDVDPCFAGRVTAGVFAEQEVQRIPRDLLRRYFRPASTPGFVEVVPELRSKVTFTQHDLLSLQPVREGLSMIVCKNVLLHFDAAQRIGVLRMFHQALQPDALLVMEHTQKVPGALAASFQQVTSHAQVYRRLRGATKGHPAERGLPGPHSGRRTDGSPTDRSSTLDTPIPSGPSRA